MSNNTKNEIAYIKRYYEIKGKEALFDQSISSVLSAIFAKKNKVIISDNVLLRGIAKLKRIEHVKYNDIVEIAVQFFALLDAFELLAQKGVPVYFYNRVGKDKAYQHYTTNEIIRMREGLSFPKMYQDMDKYEEQLRDVFGFLFSKEYIAKIGKIPQVIKVGNTYQHEDCQSKLINVVNGKRVTCNQPYKYSRTIHIYGRCGAFGYAVEDKDTLPSLIQKELSIRGINDIRVINHGLWGGEDSYVDHNFLQDSIGMKEGDIVLFYRKHFDKKILSKFIDNGVRYKEITHEWHERKNEEITFFDKPGHMNAYGYKLVAQLLCDDLLETGFACGKRIQKTNGTAENLNYYLKTRINHNFEKEVGDYVTAILKEHPLSQDLFDNGAIVMNCNPFTKGHRYLIEKAASKVNRLYIFVVEEDKSFFKFTDRFEMVLKGTEDIKNVVVVPSGRFIISAYTFPEYFMKDYVKEKDFDVSMDIETFCKYIAPPLHIKKRFAGEEPFDPVTNNYNENMANILPKYGMEFIVIPRYALDKERVINATKVRELLKTKSFDELREYVPASTYEILMNKYC